MKNIKRVLSVATLAAAFAVPTFAQASGAAAAPAAQDICTEQAKTDLYAKYYDEKSVKKDQAAAFVTGQQYLGKYSSCTDTYTTAVKKFVDAYGKGKLKIDTFAALDAKEYDKAIAAGKQYLALEPNDLQVIMLLGYYGQTAAATGNTTNNAAAIEYSRKAIELIEAGQAPEAWKPFGNKEEALAYLYYTTAELGRAGNPAEAAKIYIKAAQFESPIKKSAGTYIRLVEAYEPQYQQTLKALEPFAGKDETPESKLAFDNFYGVLERVIDAYARAVAVTTDAKQKEAWMKTLTELYKQRKEGTVDGLNELVAGVLSKPLPEPFVPATQPAAPTASATPTSGK